MMRIALFLLALAALPGPAWADPPSRVGRLSLAEGEVAVYTDPERGWESARVNAHLTSENSVWTEPGARAEVRIGPYALRLAEVTQLDLVRLDDTSLLAHVARGSVAVRLREADTGDVIVFSTPRARFQLRGNGRYRIDAEDETGASRVTVFSGNARLEVAGGYVSVDTGRSLRVGDGDRASFELYPAAASALDDWAASRNDREANREAARYVSPYVTGWEELDDHGYWRSEPEYGPVWYPTTVVAGWAPYRYGRWTWVRPWGWAWVDDAPWGYAPFHYGRWVYVGNRWGWYPGTYVRRPVWAPALVGWVGGPGWRVSISGGPVGVVGWYPLSPYERYVPWYSANVTYVNRVNHVVIVDRHGDRGRDGDRRGPRHDNRDRGATVVPRDDFAGRRPVQGAIAPVAREVIAAQPVVSGATVLPKPTDVRSGLHQGAMPSAPGAGPSGPGTAPAAPHRSPAQAGADRPAPVIPSTMAPGMSVPSGQAQPAARPAPSYPPSLIKPAPVAPQATPGVSAPSAPAATGVPAPVVPQATPAAPAQLAPQAAPGSRGPAAPAPTPRYQPSLIKPAPAERQTVPPPAQPSAQPVPAPVVPAAKPVPAPVQPATRPVPAPQPQLIKPVPAPSASPAQAVPAPAAPASRQAPSTPKPVARPIQVPEASDAPAPVAPAGREKSARP